MGLLDDITLGRYVPRDSLTHRLDARLKLAGVPVLIIAVFAARDPLQFAGLGLLATVLAGLSKIEWRLWWRGIWILRWLFLFTLLLYLFFSPGRTLFGVGWLSLDGLLSALLVCTQLSLAIVFSSLLTLTTAPRELAGALRALLAPLGRFGLPVDNLTMLLLLVLHFIPILREESITLLADSRHRGLDPSRGSLVARGRALRRMVAPLLLRLVDRADNLARAVVDGTPVVGEVATFPPFRRSGTINLAALAAGTLWLLILFRGLP